MKGSIYTTQKCYECGKNLKYVEGNGILQCKEHPQYIWTKDCRVKFDQEHIKRFPTVLEAERHLTYLRSQTDHGAYDARDWRADQPLSFRSQREKFISLLLGQCCYTVHDVFCFAIFRITSQTQAGAVLLSRRIFCHKSGVHFCDSFRHTLASIRSRPCAFNACTTSSLSRSLNPDSLSLLFLKISCRLPIS